MDAINAFLAIMAGLLVRLALPIAITVFLVALLRHMDARWQQEAELFATQPVEKVKCWEIKGCPSDQREACEGARSEKPCWQALRLDNGDLRGACLDCEVFRHAPVPMPVPVHS
jgi:hypothetical protein